jgi:hypothetical protein
MKKSIVLLSILLLGLVFLLSGCNTDKVGQAVGTLVCKSKTCAQMGWTCGTGKESNCNKLISCGTCASPKTCVKNQCICTPKCTGKTCGDDGCGGSCGKCISPKTCVNGQCKCTPNCAGKTCGDNGCGGTCGTCLTGYACQINGTCKMTPEKICSNAGGKISTKNCCKSTGDLPNTCSVGACSCSPANSHYVKICECGTGKCFSDGKCISTAKCKDGTPNGQCSRDLPYYCKEGNLMPYCSSCGCPTGGKCNTNGYCQTEAYFSFRCEDSGSSYVIKLTNSEMIAKAREVVAGRANYTIMGNISLINTTYNPKWNFNILPGAISFVEDANAKCSLTCGKIQANLQTVCTSKLLPDCVWCPRNSQLVEEVKI